MIGEDSRRTLLRDTFRYSDVEHQFKGELGLFPPLFFNQTQVRGATRLLLRTQNVFKKYLIPPYFNHTFVGGGSFSAFLKCTIYLCIFKIRILLFVSKTTQEILEEAVATFAFFFFF